MRHAAVISCPRSTEWGRRGAEGWEYGGGGRWRPGAAVGTHLADVTCCAADPEKPLRVPVPAPRPRLSRPPARLALPLPLPAPAVQRCVALAKVPEHARDAMHAAAGQTLALAIIMSDGP